MNETWNIRRDCDKMEKLIKYNTPVQYKKDTFFKKNLKLHKTIHFFSKNDSFFNTMN